MIRICIAIPPIGARQRASQVTTGHCPDRLSVQVLPIEIIVSGARLQTIREIRPDWMIWTGAAQKCSVQTATAPTASGLSSTGAILDLINATSGYDVPCRMKAAVRVWQRQRATEKRGHRGEAEGLAPQP
jgi:hypothetical protein